LSSFRIFIAAIRRVSIWYLTAARPKYTAMQDPRHRIPEPAMPEHQLLRDVGELPILSSGLRQRVVVDIHRQVSKGRWADRLQIAGSVLVAGLLVGLAWNLRGTGQNDLADKPASPTNSTTETPPSDPYSSSSSNPSSATAAMPLDPAESPEKPLPQGGPSSRDMKELQQLNQLIERIQGRGSIVCGTLQVL
jgi:hypothetical protein